ncbi:MAG: YjbE family putative metal transport protein [Betaproteobacteria bacterium]|nr:YjbE family putative metal transport protein [Betaproteobacteria bacterium]
MDLGNPEFWVALLQIIGVNIVLSGDNAVVIALAARSLPAKQQKQAVIWGSGAAVVMRIILTVVAVELLRLPYLKLVGAALLVWIGIQLLESEEEEQEGGGAAGAGLAAAIRTILIADLVMSLDNVIAVAAAAKGSLTLLILGLVISIPLVIFGSTFLMKLMERWPVIVTIGAALIGWVAGEMAATDPAIRDWVEASAQWLHAIAPGAGAVIVVAIGLWLAKRAEAREEARPVVDLALADQPARVPAAAKLRYLVAVDGSDASARALDRVLEQIARLREPAELHLLNAQPPVHGDVRTFVPEAPIRQFHHDEGARALAPARQKLDRAGTPYVVHIGVGNPAHVIAHYAKDRQCDQIFIGSRGLGGVAGTVLGSVAHELLGLAEVPVVIVR